MAKQSIKLLWWVFLDLSVFYSFAINITYYVSTVKNFKEGVIGDCVEAEVCGNEVLKRFLSFIKPKVEVKEIFNKLFTLWEERCGEPSREELENLQRDLLELPMSHQMGQQHQWDGEGSGVVLVNSQYSLL